MTTRSFSFHLIIVLSLFSCKSEKQPKIIEQKSNANTEETTTQNSFVAIFEIPATNISRAIDFYQSVLGIKIEKVDMPGMQMGVFPYKNQITSGVIIKAEGYQPSASGVTIYLNGGNNLQVILDKVEKSEGEIITTKTPHADESGYFALFLDSEGNKIGLHSPN